MSRRRIVFRADRYIIGLYPVRKVPLRYRAIYLRTILAAARAAKDCGEVWQCRSSFRSYTEQLALYQAYKNGTGNLAAVPGTSRHEKGNALDLGGPNNEDIGTSAMRRGALERRGFVFAVRGEPWHVEFKR